MVWRLQDRPSPWFRTVVDLRSRTRRLLLPPPVQCSRVLPHLKWDTMAFTTHSNLRVSRPSLQFLAFAQNCTELIIRRIMENLQVNDLCHADTLVAAYFLHKRVSPVRYNL